MSAIITLTTDFSTSDAYVGMMKGAIFCVAPDVTIVDLAHDISAHDVFQAAFVLETAYGYFPEGTVHCVVVDPGVGTVRRRLAVSCGKYFFVGPDNGVFTYPVRHEGLCDCVEIAVPEVRPGIRGVTFEGRDVFAPAAAKLASGVPLSEIGSPADKPIELNIPTPKTTEETVEGRIIYIDHFGNCISNIQAGHLESFGTNLNVSVGGHPIGTLHGSYSEAKVGDTLALVNSLGHLEIAINQGDAAEELNIHVGAPVRVVRGG